MGRGRDVYSSGFRLSDKGGGGESLKKQIFSSLRPSVWSKNRGQAPRAPPPRSATAYIGRSVFSTDLGRSKGVLLNHRVRMTWWRATKGSKGEENYSVGVGTNSPQPSPLPMLNILISWWPLKVIVFCFLLMILYLALCCRERNVN